MNKTMEKLYEIVCYNFYIKSIFAIIMGIMPLISSIIGDINEVKENS